MIDVPGLDDLVDEIPDGKWSKESIRRLYRETLKALVRLGMTESAATVALRNLYQGALADAKERATDGK